MARQKHGWKFSVLGAVLIIGGILMILGIIGCAAGKDGTGGTVVGFEVGAPMPDGLREGATTLAGLVFGPAGAGVAATVLGLGGLAAKRHADAKALAAASDAHDQAWDEAEARSKGTTPAVKS